MPITVAALQSALNQGIKSYSVYDVVWGDLGWSDDQYADTNYDKLIVPNTCTMSLS